jgi:hypothetical protein
MPSIVGTSINQSITSDGFFIRPGVYLINKRSGWTSFPPSFAEFHAPLSSSSTEPLIIHHPLAELTSGKPFSILSTIAGVDTADKLSIEIRNSSNKWKTVSMQRIDGYDYKADVPADMVTPGVINYRIMMRKGQDTYTFPGGFKGNPYAWDEWRNESYQTFVAAVNSSLEIFNPTTDRTRSCCTILTGEIILLNILPQINQISWF